ncbi:MAG: hypothetical protein RBT62_05395 [Spirochaetia bacterium]|nr:hypothetical protein [Spirochaetia bacterium]
MRLRLNHLPSLTFLVIAALAMSCQKAPDKNREVPADPATTAPETSPRSIAPESALPSVAMKPKTVVKQDTEPRASPASSLGGQDRRLILKPFAVIGSSDFELGALVDDSLEPGLRQIVKTLETSLSTGTLPIDVFAASASTISLIMYDKDSLEGIYKVRCAQPVMQSPNVASLALRAFARLPGDDRLEGSAMGLAIIVRAEDGLWLIEHFELDLAALKTSNARNKPWDPFDSGILP